MAENPFNFICLLDLYAHPYGVDGRLDEYALVLVTGYCQCVEEDFLGASVTVSSVIGEVHGV